jgi:hypothetical protein
VLEVTAWPSDEPRPWLVNVGGRAGQDVSWFVQGLQQALDAVLPRLSGKQGRFGRPKPLLATPLLGTGRGGLFAQAGDAVKAMLPLLYEAAKKWDVDVAVVTVGSEAHAAAQQVRRRAGEAAWPELGEGLRTLADDLARLVNSRRLALFLGSGVGTAVGLPRWDEFLHALAQRAGITDEQFEQVRGLDILDCASFIERRLGSTQELRNAILGILRDGRNHYSLTHALLAGLPVVEVVTTNYDTLFEKAWHAASVERQKHHYYNPVRTAIIPHTPCPDHDRWLLKLHGCVSRPESIILTRESYIRYSHQWAALEGILQAALITRHILFVGFSLTDPNFIRIVDAVRRVIRPEGAVPTGRGYPFGTALMMLNSHVMGELWADDLRWVGLSCKERSDMQAEDWSRAGRLLDVFLDYLLSRTGTGSYLLDDPYETVLSEDERKLKAKVRELEELYHSLRKEERSPAWSRVEELLAALGCVHFRKESTTPGPSTSAITP